jgi:hypothetical protein
MSVILAPSTYIVVVVTLGYKVRRADGLVLLVARKQFFSVIPNQAEPT